MASELENIHCFHKVNSSKARELLQPHLQTDGHYLLRPSSNSERGVVCTICVTNNAKLIHYQLVHDSGRFYILNHTSFPTIRVLLAYYKATPINPKANTLLLYPVGPPRQNTPISKREDAYLVMERQSPMSPTRSNSSSNEIPGLHIFLLKSEVNTVMGPYVGRNGHYLLRPRSSSEGQFALAVSYADQVLNFKINFEQGKYFITPKKLFSSIPELINHYHSHPIRSPKAGNSKILLLYPIPVDKKKDWKMQDEKATTQQQAPPPSMLAPGWTKYWDSTYNRPYYYNTKTKKSLWEKPLASPIKQASPLLSNKTPSQLADPSQMRDHPPPPLPQKSTSYNGPGPSDNSPVSSTNCPQLPSPSPKQASPLLSNKTLSQSVHPSLMRDRPPPPPPRKGKSYNGPEPSDNSSTNAPQPPSPSPATGTPVKPAIGASVKPTIGAPVKQGGQDPPEEWVEQTTTTEVFPVFRASIEWTKVEQKFRATMANQIVSISRIQNTWLWENYCTHRKRLHFKNNGAVNEMELFHGTRSIMPSVIYEGENGFDMRYSNAGLWGHANYFAVKASYSDAYAYQTIDGFKEMFLVKVLTGDSYRSPPDKSLRIPPAKTSGYGGKVQFSKMLYDTVNGTTHGCQVFMTYDNDKAYPAYLIKYH